jgi:glycosyltransferase involved in cell wall biosynthesis
MAAGCACVTSDMEPLTEFVRNDVNGLLVQPGKAELFAEAVIDLIGDPAKRERLGQAARATAFEMFDPKRAAEQLTEIYFSIRA